MSTVMGVASGPLCTSTMSGRLGAASVFGFGSGGSFSLFSRGGATVTLIDSFQGPWPASEIVTAVSNTVPTGFLYLSAWNVNVSLPLNRRNVGSSNPENSHLPLFFDRVK